MFDNWDNEWFGFLLGLLDIFLFLEDCCIGKGVVVWVFFLVVEWESGWSFLDMVVFGVKIGLVNILIFVFCLVVGYIFMNWDNCEIVFCFIVVLSVGCEFFFIIEVEFIEVVFKDMLFFEFFLIKLKCFILVKEFVFMVLVFLFFDILVVLLCWCILIVSFKGLFRGEISFLIWLFNFLIFFFNFFGWMFVFFWGSFFWDVVLLWEFLNFSFRFRLYWFYDFKLWL